MAIRKSTKQISAVLPILFGVLIFLRPAQARADILMIDLNCSEPETKAAQQVADNRNESLVVLPYRTTEQEKLCAQEHVLEMKSENTKNSQKLKTYQTQMDAIEAELHKNPIHFDLNDLKPLFQAMTDEGKIFETIIISGHLKGSFYFGLQGAFIEPSLINIIRQYPAIQEGVRSLYGWLCYSLSRIFWWDQALPNLEIVGGFDDSSLGSERPLDSQILVEMLQREDKIFAINRENHTAKTANEFASLVRSEPGITLTNAGECNRYECVGTHRIINLNSLMRSCTAKAYANTMALAPYGVDDDDPLCDTARNQEWRPFYESLRRYEFCEAEPVPLQAQFATFDGIAEKVIRKILMRQVMINFGLYYADDLPAVKSIYESCYGPGSFIDFSVPLACLPTSEDRPAAPRIHFSDITEMISKLESPLPSCGLTDRQTTILHDFSEKLKFTAKDISPNCVPGTWIEHVEDPQEMQDPDDQCEFKKK